MLSHYLRAGRDVAEKLTDEQWRKIVAIRPPLVPEADARAAIDFIRAIYFPLKSVAVERKELGSIVTLAKG
jgi:hypothetical protein